MPHPSGDTRTARRTSRRLLVSLALLAAQPAVAEAPTFLNEVPGEGDEAQGADIVVTSFDTNPAADLLLMAYDSPPGPNIFRYRAALADAGGQRPVQLVSVETDKLANVSWRPANGLDFGACK